MILLRKSVCLFVCLFFLYIVRPTNYLLPGLMQGQIEALPESKLCRNFATKLPQLSTNYGRSEWVEGILWIEMRFETGQLREAMILQAGRESISWWEAWREGWQEASRIPKHHPSGIPRRYENTFAGYFRGNVQPAWLSLCCSWCCNPQWRTRECWESWTIPLLRNLRRTDKEGYWCWVNHCNNEQRFGEICPGDAISIFHQGCLMVQVSLLFLLLSFLLLLLPFSLPPHHPCPPSSTFSFVLLLFIFFCPL